MTFEDFANLFEIMVEEEKLIGNTKGVEYAGSGDKLANFKEVGSQIKCPCCQEKLGPKVILWIFLTKHIRSVSSYINTNKTLSEPIEERIKDIRVYLSLLRALVEEEKQGGLE